MSVVLRNSAATFQTLMNPIFRDSTDYFIVIYVNHILIFSDSHDDHLKHLRLVISELQKNELYVGKY